MNILLSIVLAATLWTDSVLFAAYQREDMAVWKEYIDSITNHQSQITNRTLVYEYGYCGYIVAEAKKEGKETLLPEAKRYVQQFREHIESLSAKGGLSVERSKSEAVQQRSGLPLGHYEMYMSAVLVYELRLKISIHPIKAMSLAKEATQMAPDDPLVLSYYGTCLFYAPSPFGSKTDALKWFRRAEPLFDDPQYRFSWVREANQMYIRQCLEKLKK